MLHLYSIQTQVQVQSLAYFQRVKRCGTIKFSNKRVACLVFVCYQEPKTRPCASQASTLPLTYKPSPTFANASLDRMSELTQNPPHSLISWPLVFVLVPLIILVILNMPQFPSHQNRSNNITHVFANMFSARLLLHLSIIKTSQMMILYLLRALH